MPLFPGAHFLAAHSRAAHFGLNVSRLRTRGHSGGRRHPHRHYVVVRLLGLQLADLRIRNGLPFIGFDSCLTLRKTATERVEEASSRTTARAWTAAGG